MHRFQLKIIRLISSHKVLALSFLVVAVLSILIMIPFRKSITQAIRIPTKITPTPEITVPFQRLTSLPTSYDECIKLNIDRAKSGAVKDAGKVSCALTIYKENELVKECLKLDGDRILADPTGWTGTCTLYYYNPNYDFPDNFDECGNYLYKNLCWVYFMKRASYDKEVTQRLIDICKARGGYIDQEEDCSLSYIKYPNDTKIPTNFDECWTWEGYDKEGTSGSTSIDRECRLLFNSIENPEMYSVCQQKGGSVYPSIIINTKISSLCKLIFK